MMTLSYTRSYPDFGKQFGRLVDVRNHGGHAFGFLFDDPHLTVERSRLTPDNRAIRTLNDELGERMTVLYLHDSSSRITTPSARKLYRERIDKFNRTLISSLAAPEESIRLPCLTMFQIHNNACFYLIQVPRESRSSLFLVSDIVAGICSYWTFIWPGAGSERSYAAGSWPTVRASLTLVGLVNTVTDFTERATRVVVTLLL